VWLFGRVIRIGVMVCRRIVRGLLRRVILGDEGEVGWLRLGLGWMLDGDGEGSVSRKAYGLSSY
jgi:hypothetical protein